MKFPKITIVYLCAFTVLSCGKDNLSQDEINGVEIQKEIKEEEIQIGKTNTESEEGEVLESQKTNQEGNSTPEDTSTSVPEIDCFTNGGTAEEVGLKTWCWEDATIPDYSNKKGVLFSDGQLKVDSECYEKQVSIENNQIKFSLNPTYPAVEDWCSRDFNMRAEISTQPWKVNHSKGTEEWFGWSYTFGSDYIIDKSNHWLFFQVHPGVVGESPHTELMVIKDGQVNGHSAGEIFVINAANGKDYHPTGITPKAGETFNIVVHAVWGDTSNGLLQVWINGKSIYNKQVATVYKAYPWGGNAKWGIYKWPWAEAKGVALSQNQGILQLETFMGPLRMITRRPDDSDYGKDSYALVSPR
ncbi:hypothetical protein D9O36_06275 [Zobellia amurskyensis]|uniref:Polysaccharide lyase-like protein n=1 Tax=Zobellia amurskyensis TaxID=248905 RepID=A0A7X2ZS73_9FLAO|nr:heparin lyase I family protein [Zobellia amurskyensis]MUH35439.1 hypothetical protein [Zobellia amurskyensis]